MDSDAALLLILIASSLAAVFFTVVPLVPGTLFVLAGAVAGGFVAGWDEYNAGFWVAMAVLTAAYLLMDNVVQVFGARRVGASKQAMVGGAIGVFVGPILLGFVIGPFALLFGPPIGVLVGTLIGEARHRQRTGAAGVSGSEARRLGTVALAAFAIGTGFKLIVVMAQVALLYVALR